MRCIDPLRDHHLPADAIDRGVDEPLAFGPPLVADREIQLRHATKVDGDAADQEQVPRCRTAGDRLPGRGW